MHGRPTGSLGARAALRAATHDVHERLHVAPAFLAIAEGRLSRPHYRDHLGRLAGLYFALAPELDIEAERMNLLTMDLQALGARVPRPAAWSPPARPARRLGWKYVVEGSIFGGQVIYRQLDYLFGDEPAGRRFFAGTAMGASRWRALCQEFERVDGQAGAREQMVVGALDAFALFERALTAESVDG